ncbi:NYN domain-containing protein [Hymenobacter properus]|uniref:NYN domain-containing protein n=1 Tax=Hymenobacter properus TaxID=2791026 RepID=A0A931BEE7_9BACT|nr:NYN domain-containing protein [Hymenobacter properus]MBF9142284.1 NYN domain-containing protein [Hymenobacter properus]MBR7721091.1 NYN domain-containing protein [Microvirga sp. SRT04]
MLSKPTTSSYAAVFIDFENIYYFLKNHFHDPPDLNDYVLEIIRSLREELSGKGLDSLISYAYADFERLATAPQGALYLMGVSTRNVLGTDHKNAADMQLCIDALEVMYTRPDIGTFVLVAGDRDYIPVLQHLRRQARQVLVAGFRESVSGDLLQNIGSAQFLDARDLLGTDRVEQLEKRRTDRLRMQEESRRLREQGLVGVPSAAALAASAAADTPGTSRGPLVAPVPSAGAPRPIAPAAMRPAAPRFGEEVPDFAPVRPLAREIERRTLAFILSEFQKLEAKQQRRVPELWLGPFMRLLTDELPELPDYERRDLLNHLRDAGTIRIEKREGEPHPFSVIVVNYNHPDVQALHPGEEN